MPSHVPRTDTSKKREQSARRGQELEHAIRAALPRDESLRATEAVKAAHLLLLKAELYWSQDAKIAERDIGARIDNIEREKQRWTERTLDEILHDYTAV